MSKNIKRGQVWFHKPSTSPAGSIQRGPRPVIIVSNEVLNGTSPVVLAVPCTSQIKRNFPTHALFIMNRRVSVALAEQIMPVNVNELTTLEYTLEDFMMQQVDSALKAALALNPETNTVLHSAAPATAEPVNNSVDNVDKRPSSSQVDKFYSRYPQLSPPQRARYTRWNSEKATQLVQDFDSGVSRDDMEKKWGLPYETLRKYYHKFRDGGK